MGGPLIVFPAFTESGMLPACFKHFNCPLIHMSCFVVVRFFVCLIRNLKNAKISCFCKTKMSYVGLGTPVWELIYIALCETVVDVSRKCLVSSSTRVE